MIDQIRSPGRNGTNRSAKALFGSKCAIAALAVSLPAYTPAQAQEHGLMPELTLAVQPQAGGMPPAATQSTPPRPGLALAVQPQATAMAPGSAVLANATFDDSHASFVPGTTVDVFDILNSEVLINWVPFDPGTGGAPVSFLPAGNELQFTSSLSDYTVLNRIIPQNQNSPIRIDGRVTSFDFGGSSVGGNIWFYSPGGIIVGATGSFDVGSLVLTTNDIDLTGGFFGNNGEIRFRGAADSLAAIVLENGAQVSALNNGSYVAMVAPRVVQNGLVTVNGSVAYVAAEQADLTINNGLFDIAITVGTTDPQGIVHGPFGETTGPARTPTAANPQLGTPANPDHQAIYLVAVPKNDAITMLVSGEIGYNPAISVGELDGQIVLSAGYDVSANGRNQNNPVAISTEPVSPFATNVALSDTLFRNDAVIQSNGSIDATQFLSQSLIAFGDLTLNAADQIDLGGIFGGRVDVDGNLSLRAGTNLLGGTINLFVDRNTSDPDALGRIQVGGDLVADVSATGSQSQAPGVAGEDVQAGSIVTTVSQGGRLDIGGSASFLADALGGAGGSAPAPSTSLAVQPPQLQQAITGIPVATPLAIPTDPAADGGDGFGGTIVFNLDSGSTAVSTLTVSANGFGGSGGAGDGFAAMGSGNGGDGYGGSATFNASGGTLSVGTLTISANGNSVSSGSEGGFGAGADGGNGGNGFGGFATLNLEGSALIGAQEVIISADGFGGRGGNSDTAFGGGGATLDAGVGGNGGNGEGGDAVFHNTSGTLVFQFLTVQSIGLGGNGGGSFGISVGQAVEDGGDGGTGTGGNATINFNQPDTNNPPYNVNAGAGGGNGGSGLNGGHGGDAFGGTAAINVNDVTAQLNSPNILADAVGGDGGFPDSGIGNGGHGGNATGGTARIQVAGPSGNLPIFSLTLNSDALGGDGGDGDTFDGNGGDGGAGTGGTSEFVALSGGTLTITATSGFSVSSSGVGGDGGNVTAASSGSAGDGGAGTGGSARAFAQGGTITADEINFLGNGTGGNGGTSGGSMITGSGGIGSGGAAVIEVQDGSPGIITFGATFMQANGTDGLGAAPNANGNLGGRIDIIDASPDAAGLITLASLTAEAFGLPASASSGFYASSGSGAIAVAGDVDIAVGGNVEFAFDGDGQMTVGGNLTITTDSSILVSHSNRPTGLNSLDINGFFLATAQQNFDSSDGSRIRSGAETDVRAEGDLYAADVNATDQLILSAGQNATLGDGSVGGTPAFASPVIRIEAGVDFTGGPPVYDPNYSATIFGTVSSAGNIEVFAGGSALIQTGAEIGADNRIAIQTGDDIIIESGATVSAGLNPFLPVDPLDPFSDDAILSLDAGALFASLSSTPLTPIASIVNQGTLNAPNSAIVMLGEAIDGTGGQLNASSIKADINNAPANGVVQSDDNGLLSGDCVQGNICLGDFTADNRVEIGQTGLPIQVFIEGGAVLADTILISARRDIIIGTDGTISTFNGASQLLLESTEGDVLLRDASLSSDQLQIFAGLSLLGTGSLFSTNDIGITVGADLVAAEIETGGQITTATLIGGALEPQFVVPGSIAVETLTIGTGNVDIVAGVDIDLGLVTVPAGMDINLLAAGDATLGATRGAENIAIEATNIVFGDSVTASDDFGTATLLATDNIALGGLGGSLLTAMAGGTIDIFDALAITTATFESVDIEIDGNGEISGDTLTFLSNADGPMYIGGNDADHAPFYSLDATEIVGISGEFVEFVNRTIPPSGPAMILEFFTINGSDGAGGSSASTGATGAAVVSANNLTVAGGAFQFSAAGQIRVEGEITIANAVAGNSLILDSQDSIHVVTPLGSLAVVDSSGLLTGNLVLTAPEIVSASQAVIAALAGTADIDARNTLLGENDGPTNFDGYLRAGTIDLAADLAIYIQNSGLNTGLFDDRAGFTAGAGGLILNAFSGDVEIIINGRLDSGAVTGIDALNATSINGNFAAGSTINNCLISNPAICVIIQTDTPDYPVQDIVDTILASSGVYLGPTPEPLIEAAEVDPIREQPIIDDPVTGTGNDDLWNPQSGGMD